MDALEAELAACQQVARRQLAGDDEPVDLGGLEGRVKRALAQERGALAALRSLPTHQRVGVVLALSVFVTVASLVMTPRGDLAAYPVVPMTMTLVILFALTAFASWRLLRPLHLPPPGRVGGWLLLAGGMIMPFVMAVVPLAHAGHPAGEGAAFLSGCMRCLLFGGALGLPVLVVALAMRRALTDGAAIAALAGVAAGLTGNLVLQLHCPITDRAHLLLGHASLLVVITGAAWLWGRVRS